MIVRTILAVLVASCLAGAACAQDTPGPRDEVGEKLGALVAPPGGRAYRQTWIGPVNGGFIEIVVASDGAARLRTSGREEGVTLTPGDLRGFEAELAQAKPSDFQQPNMHDCLDECAYYFLEVVANGERRHTRVPHQANPLLYAAWEMDQLAILRTGGAFATPAPWWTREGRERPTPRILGPQTAACTEVDRACLHNVWFGARSGLGLLDMVPIDTELERRTYRLMAIPEAGPPRAITLALFDDRRRENCSYPVVFSCPPVIDGARIGLDGGKPRRTNLKRALAVENAFFAAGLSDMPAGGETPCPQGEVWVLEALVGKRYRAVTGNACDAHGLGPAIEALRKLAKR